jgi:catechol 2,3-dioxygenase
MTAPRDPEELGTTALPAHAQIADDATVGAVHLSVADLDRSLDYYRTQIGLSILERSERSAVLGAGTRDLLHLAEEPGARPADGYAGLYHFALLVPQRIHLAAWLAHAARDRVGLTGMSDHFVSEALYLRDPDGHGIEIYWDRPRAGWEGRVSENLTTMPLDTDSILNELDDPETAPFDGLPDGTVMGHLHLRVTSIEPTVGFYRDVLGFALMAQLGSMAAFLAAGGYHHHVGANTWESAGRPAAPPGHATLRHATILLPDAGERDNVVSRVEHAGIPVEELEGDPLVRDPSGNALALTLV